MAPFARIFVLLIFLLPVFWGTAAGGASIEVSVLEAGNIRLDGRDFVDIVAADLTLLYDAATFANPRVEAGAWSKDALLAANPVKPGEVRMAFVRSMPLNGSGTLAELYGSPVAAGPVRVLSLRGSLLDVHGNTVPFQFIAPRALEPPAPPRESDSVSSPAAPSDVGPGEISLSGVHGFAVVHQPAHSVILPGSEELLASENRYETEETPSAPEPRHEQTSAHEREDSQAYQPSENYLVTSVLSRFHADDADRSFQRLSAYFQADDQQLFTQKPAIVLSDGQASVHLRIAPLNLAGEVNLALRDGTLNAVRKADQGGWDVDILPKKGTWETTVYVVGGGMILRIPLVVAPQLPGELVDMCADIAESELPRRDVNQDGFIDGVDDFIWVANCLAEAMH